MKTIRDVYHKLGLAYVAFITILGIHLRLWWINNIPTKPVFDFETYQEIATNIFHRLGHSFRGEPIAFQGMGYPTVLGILYRIMGSNDLYIAKIFHVILSSLTLIIAYFIFHKLFQRRAAVYLAYTIMALLPNYLAYNNVISTEAFFTFLLTAIIFLQLYFPEKRWSYILLGGFTGIAALTKPFFMAYPVIIAVAFWLKKKNLKETLIQFGMVFLIMALMIAPWTYRNYQKFGRLIPISYNSGYVLFINNNGNNTTGAWMSPQDAEAPAEVHQKINEILKDGNRSEKIAHDLEPVIKAAVKEWIKKHPTEFMKLGILRLKATFFNGAWDINAWAMNELEWSDTEWKEVEYLRNMNFFRGMNDWIIYTLSAFGFLYVLANVKNILVGLFKKEHLVKDRIILSVLNIAFFVAICFVYEGQARYNYPVLFFFIIALVDTVGAITSHNKVERE
ncbi:4-amino-4-deoxy-L-arabinose transferase-like glycosyltransferase [Anaerosolibacter carboniphilus]|uniref:4-amino-4-deoxy-L-arabinose transferase-like glycosyltransferase n=1 Tax=Anaerosolibacter carboniphilus TaxID=1417629 RepID=A0A841KTV7_9FIRM|nr:glycosyltransferase family 39 protein [Anaerosolibacter carboniphilus]MBB6215598.1 4-amino-4-deoxy-L-arabinose transferase-like glycosyltransferase [Anaerosolibacter carboniphilus]